MVSELIVSRQMQYTVYRTATCARNKSVMHAGACTRTLARAGDHATTRKRQRARDNAHATTRTRQRARDNAHATTRKRQRARDNAHWTTRQRARDHAHATMHTLPLLLNILRGLIWNDRCVSQRNFSSCHTSIKFYLYDDMFDSDRPFHVQ